MKKTALLVGGLALLAGLGWLGVFFYWHVTLRNAIQYFEDHASDVPRPWDPLADTEAFATMRASGCRSIPYLVGAISSSKDPEFQRGLSLLVFFAATKVESTEATRSLQTIELLLADDTPQEHQKKTDALRAWWARDGRLYHQWWRVWSAKCR